MSTKLLVQNIPSTLSYDQFKSLFIDFNGFKDCRIMGMDEKQQYISE